MKNMKVVNKLKAQPKKYPLSSHKYEAANAFANELEKNKYPKGYESLKKIEKKMPHGEVLGHISKKGKISVSKKVPKKNRKEVAEHDINERKYIKRKT